MDGLTDEVIRNLSVIDPDASEEAISIIGAKKNLRPLSCRRPARSARAGPDHEDRRRRHAGADARNAVVDEMNLKTVMKRPPSSAELRDLKFAFCVAKHVKSNTIVDAEELAPSASAPAR